MDLGQTERAWEDFVQAIGTMHEKFKEGSKGCNKSQAWFGRVVRDRRKDPLLRYVHAARNADHHGIAPGTAVSHGGLRVVSAGEYGVGGTLKVTSTYRMAVDARGRGRLIASGETENNLNFTHISGEPLRTEILPPHRVLVTVHDTLHGDSFAPPTIHFGKRLENQRPATVARLALDYYERRLREANQLPVRS